MSNAGKFNDLSTRLISAGVMLAIAAVAIMVGGTLFNGLLAVCAGLMAWETLRMHQAKRYYNEIASLCVAVCALALMYIMAPKMILAALILVVLCALLAANSRVVVGIYILAIILACVSLANIREPSVAPVMLVIGCVIASDVGGYFAGRIFGGPKLWPAVSPKKTWSGTIGGWVLAVLVALGFYMNGGWGLGILVLAIFIAIAAQLGDLFESWIKRRAGIKDASNLIPGHGGLLDRFDGLIGAALFVGLVSKFI